MDGKINEKWMIFEVPIPYNRALVGATERLHPQQSDSACTFESETFVNHFENRAFVVACGACCGGIDLESDLRPCTHRE